MAPLTPAQRHLAATHHHLVAVAVRVAWAQGWRGDRNEALSAAGWGLCRAAATYNPALGASFRRHALRRMIGQIRRLNRPRLPVPVDPAVLAATTGAACSTDDPVARTLHRLHLEHLHLEQHDTQLLVATMHRGGAAALARQRGVTHSAITHAATNLRRRLAQVA